MTSLKLPNIREICMNTYTSTKNNWLDLPKETLTMNEYYFE